MTDGIERTDATIISSQKPGIASKVDLASMLAGELTSPGGDFDADKRCDLLLAPAVLERWRLTPDRTALFVDDVFKNSVVFGSLGGDVAESPIRATQTELLCEVLLRLTSFQIRLLSRSSLLANQVAKELHRRLPGAAKSRIMFGLVFGDFPAATDAKSQEEVAQALGWLQDHGFRTFCVLGSAKGVGDSKTDVTPPKQYVERCEAVLISQGE